MRCTMVKSMLNQKRERNPLGEHSSCRGLVQISFVCGLARLARDRSAKGFAQTTANYSVGFALLPMICISGGISAEPIAHRIVLAVVFAWIVLNSIQLLRLSLTIRIAS